MKKEQLMNIFKGDIVTIICATVFGLACIIGLSTYHINDRQLMADNINKAIERGIQPLSVRCSYAEGDDAICLAFSIGASNNMVFEDEQDKK